MSDYKLPDGFHWVIQESEHLLFEHTATEKRCGISGLFTRGKPSEAIQREIYRSCFKLLRENALDVLFRDCGYDHEEFAKRRDDVIAEWLEAVRPMFEVAA